MRLQWMNLKVDIKKILEVHFNLFKKPANAGFFNGEIRHE